MKLYDGAWAPSPRRVRIFLAEKGIEIERVVLDLRHGEHLEPDYAGINPQRQLPSLLLDDGTLIDDSIAICRYFEALQPDPPLFGGTPREIGLVEAWLRRIEHDCFQAVAIALRNRSPAFAGRAVSGQWPPIEQIPALVDRGRCMWDAFATVLDGHLADQAYIAGDDFTMADIAGLAAIDFGIDTRMPDPREGRPALARWHAAVAARPSASA
ncbi:glutathione S-transferase family protein [Rhizorhabdus dicambivorans]|uniref:Glutathione S-transferase family protein n=1 Tax=Rhizorhabdus dicambivorans TaxID=1850238 RepID=A0A2A4G388_9SPHN|nr:glutathione S-transferase family protein [Rhizorhabdus dicambivorans]ATE64959.1 glutathione S-transferase family protein [Rhizorhabdus dicambivorans]PCE44233.1 glutathione S-transferase family protein [Rhizorhabdus dicambivorans]